MELLVLCFWYRLICIMIIGVEKIVDLCGENKRFNGEVKKNE